MNSAIIAKCRSVFKSEEAMGALIYPAPAPMQRYQRSYLLSYKCNKCHSIWQIIILQILLQVALSVFFRLVVHALWKNCNLQVACQSASCKLQTTM